MSRKGIVTLFVFLTSLCGVALGESGPSVETRLIPAQTYEMGGFVDYGYGRVDGPRREIRFASAFAIARYEVTVGEFRRFVEATNHVSEDLCNVYTDTTTWHIDRDANWDDPGFPQDDDHPVVCVSWHDAQAYIEWINRESGSSYRLPSEAEWEFATLESGFGQAPDGELGHEEGNIGRRECCGGEADGADRWVFTAPVGSFAPDRNGLFDIRGNVWEWLADCYEADYAGAPVDGSPRTRCADDSVRAVRGGSYGDSGIHQLPRFRLPGKRSQGYFTVGFRLAHDVE